MFKKVIVILFLIILSPNLQAESKNADLNIRKFLVRFMKIEYPNPEYINAFDLKNLKSYRTYKTRCGKFYSVKATDFSDSSAYGYCGSGGCDNFFFKYVQGKLKFIYNYYFETINGELPDTLIKNNECLVLDVMLHGLESKDMKRAGQDWIHASVHFTNKKVFLVKNDY